MSTMDLVADQLDEELQDVDLRLDELQARAEIGGTLGELQALVGLRIAREHARQKCDELKQLVVEDLETAEDAAVMALLELEERIDRFSDRFGEWDASHERRLTVQLGQAEAMLQLWRTRPDWKAFRRGAEREALALLDRRIAQTRALAATHDREPDNRQVRDALAEASRLLEQAFLNAVRRFE